MGNKAFSLYGEEWDWRRVFKKAQKSVIKGSLLFPSCELFAFFADTIIHQTVMVLWISAVIFAVRTLCFFGAKFHKSSNNNIYSLTNFCGYNKKAFLWGNTVLMTRYLLYVFLFSYYYTIDH